MKKLFPLSVTILLLSCASSSSSLPFGSSDAESPILESSLSSAEEAISASFRLLSWNVYLGRGNMDYLVEIVENYCPDIINFQECTVPCANMKKDLLGRNPDYVLIDDAVGEMLCATPILFNAAKFDLLDNGTEMLKDAYQGVTTKSLAWAVLEEKESEKLLIHLNFHGAVCTANYDGYETYTDEERQEIAATWRRGNVAQLMDKAEELKEAYGCDAISFSGDCNFDADSLAYSDVLGRGYFDAETSATESFCQDGLKTSHALSGAPSEGKSIDHIFCSAGLWIKTHDIDRSAKALKASDHCPVIADIAMEEAPYA